jgi:catalase
MQGIQNFHREEAIEMVGKDPDFSQRDLVSAIEGGEFPRWRVSVQIMRQEEAELSPCNPFDLTKVWHQRQFPLREVGIMTLHRNPKNYFAEVEQAAFAPANIVPGMGYSPDKMLQARILSYPDAHRHRMGVNYDLLPVNRPQCSVHTYHRDGHMRFDENGGLSPNYEPNSFGGPVEDRRYRDEPWDIGGHPVDRYDHRAGNDDYTQPGDLYRLLPSGEQERLVHNIVMSLREVPKEIRLRQLHHFMKADPGYGHAVADGLGFNTEDLKAPDELAGTRR